MMRIFVIAILLVSMAVLVGCEKKESLSVTTPSGTMTVK